METNYHRCQYLKSEIWDLYKRIIICLRKKTVTDSEGLMLKEAKWTMDNRGQGSQQCCATDTLGKFSFPEYGHQPFQSSKPTGYWYGPINKWMGGHGQKFILGQLEMENTVGRAFHDNYFSRLPLVQKIIPFVSTCLIKT